MAKCEHEWEYWNEDDRHKNHVARWKKCKKCGEMGKTFSNKFKEEN